jgi:hypothetical protein
MITGLAGIMGGELAEERGYCSTAHILKPNYITVLTF